MRLTYLIPTIAVCGFTGCWKVVSNPRSATTATYAKPPDLPPLARLKRSILESWSWRHFLLQFCFQVRSSSQWFHDSHKDSKACIFVGPIKKSVSHLSHKKEALQLEHKTQHLRFLQDTTLLLWSTAQICLGKKSSTRFRPRSCLKLLGYTLMVDDSTKDKKIQKRWDSRGFLKGE